MHRSSGPGIAAGASRRLVVIAAFTVAIAVAAAAPLAAWSPTTQVSIARTAARLAPPDLARQIEHRADRFRDGVLAPFQEGVPERHYRNRDRGALDAALADEVAGAVAALREPAPFDDVVYRLGRIAHWVGDANNPLNAAGDDPDEGRYFADWLRYADSARPRFAPVFYLGEPTVQSDRDVRLLVLRALQRGRDLYPRVGDEYRRVHFASGAAAFDDRSTAFGVAAISFSHAITDVARVLHYVWLAGGGGDQRPELWTTAAVSGPGHPEQRLLLLPKAGGR
ncbi:MAG TPA: hypothetical protein VGS57_10860 [Thermoanaerobaculia bacterium]|jgi:hypothetical protein|nr:hypothetical protein [Thermoanaerobaculia bacterium]